MPGPERLEIIVQMTDFASKAFKKISSGISAGMRFIRRAIGGATGALTGFVAGLATKEFAQYVGRVQGIDAAFRNLGATMGGASQLLLALQKATRFAVSEMELMRLANNAVVLGVTKSRTEMAELADVARRLGKAVGRDAAESFQDLVLGVGRMSRLILDNLGIVVRSTEAQERYALTIGKTVRQLTEQEKRQAFLQETLRAAREALAKFGPDILTVGEQFGKLDAAIKDFGTHLIRFFTPKMSHVLGIIDFSLATLIEHSVFVLKALAEVVILVFNQIAIAYKKVRDIAWLPLKVAEAGFDFLGTAWHSANALVERLAMAIGQAKVLGFTWNQFLKTYTEGGPIAAAAEKYILGKVDKWFGTSFSKTAEKAPDILDRITKSLVELKKKLTGGKDLEEWIRDGLSAYEEYSEQEIYDANKAAFRNAQAKFLGTGLHLGQTPRSLAERLPPAPENTKEWEQMHLAAEGAQMAFNDMATEATRWGDATRHVIEDITLGITDGITDGLVSLIDGTKSAKEAFRDMARSILKDISRIIIQTLVLKAVQAGIGGLFGTDQDPGVSPITHIAKGANGGIVNASYGGSVIRVAEAGKAEAIVPLPNNRSIPVEMVGSGMSGGPQVVQNITFNHSYTSPLDERRLIERNKRGIVDAVIEANNSSMSSHRGLS